MFVEAFQIVFNDGDSREVSFYFSTPPWIIRFKARVDLGDQTTEFIPFEVLRTAILTYFYLFYGIIYAF